MDELLSQSVAVFRSIINLAKGRQGWLEHPRIITSYKYGIIPYIR